MAESAVSASHGGALTESLTFPQCLLAHARMRPEAPAMREKYLGIWQTTTWSALSTMVLQMAAGLAARGLKRGDHIALIGDNRPRLYASMIAAQCLGAIPVPMYQDAVAAEMVYVFRDASIRIAVVENQEQTDKVLEIREQCPQLSDIIYDDDRGLRNYQQSGIESIDALLEAGAVYEQAHPEIGRAHV